MTLGIDQPNAFSVGICPVDGTAQNAADMLEAANQASKDRIEIWSESVKYEANQRLAMAVLSQLAQQYFAEKAMEAAKDAAEKQYDIANRNMTIAEEEYQRYKDHFICNENKMGEEACLPWDENPDYAAAESRATRNARLAFGPQWGALERNRSRYCACDSLHDACDLAAEEAKALVSARNASYQIENANSRVAREYYDNFRNSIFSLGRGLQTNQLSTYSTAGVSASNALGALAQAKIERYGAAAGGINNVLSAYFTPRINNPQVYNGSFTQNQQSLQVTGNNAVFNGYTTNAALSNNYSMGTPIIAGQ